MNATQLTIRKTVKNFLPKDIPADIIDTALHAAWRAPTAYNARPTRIYDITGKREAPWLAGQQSPKTAHQLFLFCFSPLEAEQNIRAFIAQRFGTATNDAKVDTVIERALTTPSEFCRNQLYLSAGYFSAALELSNVAGCWIAGFDKHAAKTDLALPDDITPELVYACGYADPENPGTNETDFVRPFESFYFPSNF